MRALYVLGIMALLSISWVQLASAANRRYEYDTDGDDDEPSAAFWVVTGVAGAVALGLIIIVIWYCCCPSSAAVTGTTPSTQYSAVLQNVQSASGQSTTPLVFSPAGAPILGMGKRE